MTTRLRKTDGSRLSHVDNLKTLLVAWIIGGHALAGYTAVGGWPYDEVNEVTLTAPVEFVLIVLIGPSGLFFIGGFFFLAGLFTTASLDRKGPGRFALDRVVRLGVPWVVSALVVWPLTMWLAYRAAGRTESVVDVVLTRSPLLDSGSLWFALVLLLFSLGLAAWRAVRREYRPPTAAPGPALLVAVAAVVVIGVFVVRLVWPARSAQVLDLHLWQWPPCLAMFCLGVRCARYGWAREVPARVRRPATAATVTILVALPLVAVAAGVTDVAADAGPFFGGWRWQALVTAVVEGALVVAGSVALLGLAQRRLTASGSVATACSRGAFVAFVVQGPVLVLLATALRPAALPAEVKALLVMVLAAVACFWLGSRVVARRED